MGYSVINPSSQVDAIKQNWKTHHLINIFLLSTSLPFWIATPFLTRDVLTNGWHKFFRFSSITYAILASGSSLYLTTQLGEMKPKIDAIKKREQTEFKHSIASDLYLAQSTNTAIAQYLLSERSTELSSEQFTENELLNDSVHDGSSENTPAVQNRSELSERHGSAVQNRSENSSSPELSAISEEYLDAVLEALEDGISDSTIIKEVLGFKNYRYKEGKAILREIKQFLDLEEA